MEVKMQKENIKNEILNLINNLGLLPRNDINNILMFLDNNEFGVALDTLCSQLYENDIKISSIMYKNIEEIGKTMDMSDSTWTFLAELIDDTV